MHAHTSTAATTPAAAHIILGVLSDSGGRPTTGSGDKRRAVPGRIHPGRPCFDGRVNPDEELVYEVDENDRILRIVRRGELTDKNLRHRSVEILFRDNAGRILVHRRAAAKRVFPQYYDMFVAGMVPAGESYDQAARREAGEEVGQRNVLLRPVGRWRFDDDRVPQWGSVYTATVTGPVVPQVEEVEWFGFLTEAELAEKIGQDKFCPDSLYFYRRLRREAY